MFIYPKRGRLMFMFRIRAGIHEDELFLMLFSVDYIEHVNGRSMENSRIFECWHFWTGFGKDLDKSDIKSIHELIINTEQKHQNVQYKINRIVDFLRKGFLLVNLQKFLLHITVQAEFLKWRTWNGVQHPYVESRNRITSLRKFVVVI